MLKFISSHRVYSILVILIITISVLEVYSLYKISVQIDQKNIYPIYNGDIYELEEVEENLEYAKTDNVDTASSDVVQEDFIISATPFVMDNDRLKTNVDPSAKYLYSTFTITNNTSYNAKLNVSDFEVYTETGSYPVYNEGLLVSDTIDGTKLLAPGATTSFDVYIKVYDDEEITNIQFINNDEYYTFDY